MVNSFQHTTPSSLNSHTTATQSHSSGASVFVSGQHTLYHNWLGWGHGGDKILSSGLNVEAKNDKRHSINMSQRRHSAIAGDQTRQCRRSRVLLNIERSERQTRRYRNWVSKKLKVWQQRRFKGAGVKRWNKVTNWVITTSEKVNKRQRVKPERPTYAEEAESTAWRISHRLKVREKRASEVKVWGRKVGDLWCQNESNRTQ